MSPTKALKGSMDTLMEASMIHNMPAATHNAGELGITINANEARMAPVRKYGRLRKDTRCAQTRRMIGIAFNLGWPSLMRLDKQSLGDPTQSHCSRVVLRLTRGQIVRWLNIWNEDFLRLNRTRSQSGERDRSAHELEKAPPADRVVPFRCSRWEFTVEKLLESFGIRELFQTPPILPARFRAQLRTKRAKVMVMISG